jgi:cytochrome oxidase Cu insertion factor (SCO1/SenC/PrrC family)
MDDYLYGWMVRIRRADLQRTADELAWLASRGRSPQPDAGRRSGARSIEATTGTRAGARRAILALAAGVALAGVGVPAVGWAHGAHPTAGAGEAVSATDTPLQARSARFDFDPPRPGSYRLPVVKPAADGAVLDAGGVPRRLREVLAGKVVVLSFIFTRCSDANGCPLATAVLHQIHGATAGDPELVRRVKLLTLSFDPGHDTPETMAKYARVAVASETRSPWEFLTAASERELRPILAGYGQLVQRPTGPPAPGVTDASPTHLLRVYLIDPQQRIRNIYRLDFLDPRLLLADIRTVLLEERQARR